MRVKITEDALRDLDEDSGQHYNLSKDDVVTVPTTVGEKWCGLGWAEDIDGNVVTGERIPGARTLSVQKATHTSRGRNRG